MNVLLKLLSVVLFFPVLVSQAQEVHHLDVTRDPVKISKKFLFYIDETNQLTVQDVADRSGLLDLNSDYPNFNLTKATVWARGKFTCSEAHAFFLWIDPPSFVDLKMYQRNGTNEWKKTESGFLYGPGERQVANHHILFGLDVSPGDTTTVLISVNHPFPIMFDLRAGTAESFIGPFGLSDIFFNTCFGIILMMMIYNLYLFITHKNRIYIYYVLFVLFNLLFALNLNGFLIYFHSAAREILFYSPQFIPVVFGFFGVLFTQELFREALPRFFHPVKYVFFTGGILVAIAGTTRFVFEAEAFLQLLGVMFSAICITTGINALLKKHSAAFFYLLGFGAYTLTIVYLVVSSQDILPFNSYLWKILVLGSVLECIMLSFALGDKLKYFQKEREKAKEEALLQATENARLIQEQNKMLEEKVRERTIELQEKNKEVMDSIHYARRIQNTLLAQESLLREFIPEHFILFKPKDIVSGDFYWATQRDNRLYIAVCDSTGHGVPGAFMSLLNISFLNEAITEKNIVQPNEIFNYVRKRLIENISKDGQKDGMDGVLLCVDRSSDEISYAAANCTPVVLNNNILHELKSDKMPVGEGIRTESFNLYKIEERKGLLYLFTDGYADQFGGPQGKKYKYKRLYEQLNSISRSPLIQQKDLLHSSFEEWKGPLEQIDDVCVVGMRL